MVMCLCDNDVIKVVVRYNGSCRLHDVMVHVMMMSW